MQCARARLILYTFVKLCSIFTLGSRINFTESVDISDFEETDLELVDDTAVEGTKPTDKATEESKTTPAEVIRYSGFLMACI